MNIRKKIEYKVFYDICHKSFREIGEKYDYDNSYKINNEMFTPIGIEINQIKNTIKDEVGKRRDRN